MATGHNVTVFTEGNPAGDVTFHELDFAGLTTETEVVNAMIAPVDEAWIAYAEKGHELVQREDGFVVLMPDNRVELWTFVLDTDQVRDADITHDISSPA